MDPTTFLLLAIVVALIFDYINGFHDAANSIATVVSTRVLTPGVAVVWAAFFNFVAAFTFGTAVAKTIGKGLIDVTVIDNHVIMGGLIGAIAWDLITWYYGIPSSSSHALIGGYAGAAVAKAGVACIIPSGWTKTVLFIFLSPAIGMILGWTLMMLINILCFRSSPGRVDRWFRRLQLVSAGLYSLGHGTNDAQKTMGIITGLLVANGHLDTFDVPYWVVLICHAAIAAGTLSGGWRIVKTMGQRITKLKPVGGFAAETAGAITIIGSAVGGIPVSTTHTITGSILGVGATQRLSAVRWGVAGDIVWAWILTIPASAAMAAVAYFFLHRIGYFPA
ncbi:MAG TPA: inorganic phosphate transporter [Candidatus Polarisedimenticolia bacterium]|nr:inorganic phosphate transporter [Candidatus Polarisedimenticolia bacterium]